MTRNDGFEYREQLGPRDERQSLLEYLSGRYRHSSAREWRSRIESGQVLLDSERAEPEAALRRGQTLVWRRPPWSEPDAPEAFEILYEDDDLLAVCKPAGLPTLPGANFVRATLLYRVRAYRADAAPVHRLGRWTSGVVLFARSRIARAKLSRQFAAQKIGKRYRALADGDPEWGEFTINVPIGRAPHSLLGSVHAASPAGKASSSRVAVIERRGDEFLCDVRIATGRPHQIRIHLAAAGHPLVGDRLYGAGGAPLPGAAALPGDPGYHLHAAELKFLHPRTDREVTIECEPPRALRTEIYPANDG